MKLQFWGVRGSISTPLLQEQIQAKISAAIQRITQRDIESADAKEKFIASLPEWLYGTVGGNTSCCELTTSDNETIILDCGTGIRELGKKNFGNNKKTFHILLSHFHWDHIQGLPFFSPAFNPENEIHVYSVFPAMARRLEEQMSRPFFPVPLAAFTKKFFFHTIKPGVQFSIGNTVIDNKKMRHPGNSYSFSFSENGKKIVYSTDVELIPADLQTCHDDRFFLDADALVLDSQYTVEDAYAKMNWGHSPFTLAVDFAMKSNVKSLYLFHHEPNYDDKKIYSILQSAAWYADYAGKKDMGIHLAVEGQSIVV